MTPVGRRARTPSIQPRPGRPPALHLGEDHGQVVLAGDLLDALDDLERPVALELVEDHLEERRRADRLVRPLVAVLADDAPRPAGGSRARRPTGR